MPRSRSIAPVSALAATLLATHVARAQDANMGFTQGLEMTRLLSRELDADASSGRATRRAAAASLAADALRFRRDPAVSRRVRERVAASAGGNVLQRMAMRSAITGGAVYDNAARAMRQYGLDPDDAGDAMTAYLTSLWLLANDPPRTPTRAELQGVRAQVRRALAANPGSPVFASDAARQELGETLAHRMALVEMAADPAVKRGDAAGLARVKDAAASAGRQSLGVDLRALALTDRGLQPLGASSGGSLGARADAAASASAEREAADAPAPAAPTTSTAPRGGARGAFDASGIAHVVLRFTMTPGVSGGSSADFNPTILYQDGRAVDPDDPRPDGRGRWRQEGPRAVSVVWESGRRSRWENIGSGSYFYARPGAPAGGLNGTYKSLSGGGTAEVTVFSARDITFRPDGTFSLDASGGGFSAGSAASARRRAAGRYAVQGWAITLTYAGGHADRGLFYRYPDSDGTVGIGGPGGVRTYIRER